MKKYSFKKVVGLQRDYWTSDIVRQKILYVRYSCIKAGNFVLHSIIEYYMWKIVKTRLAYHIAYHKSIIKSLCTCIQQTIKQGHTCGRHLPLFTFTLNSDDTWSFYLSKVFLKNNKSTCMTRLLLNCYLSWIRFFYQENVYCFFFLSSMLMYLNLLSLCGDPPSYMLD